MKKKIAMLTAVCVLAFSTPSRAANFVDMPSSDSRFYDAFVYAIEKNIITGDGAYLNPSANLTFAEALTFISRVKPFDCEMTDITPFGVSTDKWYYSTVAKAYTLGYISLDDSAQLNPERYLTQNEASALISRVFSASPLSTASGDNCTRAEFIWQIYYYSKDSSVTDKSEEITAPTEDATDAPTEKASEFSDLKAQAAQEAMQVALGIRPDGTSYITRVVYTDDSQTDWQSGGISSSSRPSSGSTNRPGKDDEEETEAPTKDNNSDTDEPTTNAPSEAPTEPETPEPTYGNYDGPVDNEKDNVLDDPFNDGWRPPGWTGDGDDNDNNSGGDGWDDEDDDFYINDDDDPDYKPEKPTEDKTEEPTDDVSEVPSEDNSEEPTDDVSEVPSEDNSEEPTDDNSDSPTENNSDEPTDDVSEKPTEDNSEDNSENSENDNLLVSYCDDSEILHNYIIPKERWLN